MCFDQFVIGGIDCVFCQNCGCGLIQCIGFWVDSDGFDSVFIFGQFYIYVYCGFVNVGDFCGGFMCVCQCFDMRNVGCKFQNMVVIQVYYVVYMGVVKIIVNCVLVWLRFMIVFGFVMGDVRK